VTVRNLSQRLGDVWPELERVLSHGGMPPSQFAVAEIRCKTVWVPMRDGVRLATDIYLPPLRAAPVVAMRTPYGRSADGGGLIESFMSFARRGYAVVAQDCRGTGGSEPNEWDYYVYESEDGCDLVEWITTQSWHSGFIGSCGGSYVGQTQWCMATHAAMSAIAPSVSGLGVALNTARLYMFLNAYARVVGKGEHKVAVPITEMERTFEAETMAGGLFNDPLHTKFSGDVMSLFPQLEELPPAEGKRWLWERYCGMTCAQRAQFLRSALGVSNFTSIDAESLPIIFGHKVSPDALTVPDVDSAHLCRRIQAPPLLHTGWYDWALNDALATWELLRSEGQAHVAASARLLVTPYAHHTSGYREGIEGHPELLRTPNTLNAVGMLLHWFAAVRENKTSAWPTVIYYLMGANEWRVASDWPVPEAKQCSFYLGGAGTLRRQGPERECVPDRYVYDPLDPTPTVGGSIVSYVYPPGGVDVSAVQHRADVLVYTTAPLDGDLDVVGPIRMLLYASSSAVDTDFVARLSDVFPDGRAIQIQSGILRGRFRQVDHEPELLVPGRVYLFDIDLWATANRFKTGHRLRVDISSADFPHFDRNSNRGGASGDPIPAEQTIYHNAQYPSCLVLSVLHD
jgi:uncharacterized protein